MKSARTMLDWGLVCLAIAFALFDGLTALAALVWLGGTVLSAPPWWLWFLRGTLLAVACGWWVQGRRRGPGVVIAVSLLSGAYGLGFSAYPLESEGRAWGWVLLAVGALVYVSPLLQRDRDA